MNTPSLTTIPLFMYLAFGVQNLYAEEGEEKSKTIASSTPESTKSVIKKKMNLEEQKAALFMKAFGKKIPSVYYPHDMQLVLDESISIQMTIDINPYTQEIRFQSEEIKEFLEQNLQKQPLQKRLGADQNPTMNEDELRKYGFELQTNLKRQTVRITSPVELRKKMNLHLRSPHPFIKIPETGTKPISGYVNMFHSINSHLNDHTYNGNYNVNINLQDWIFQSEIVHHHNAQGSTTTRTARIVKDLISDRIRLTFGDNNSPNTDIFLERAPWGSGFQQALVGFDISHAGRLRRRAIQSRNFQYELTLKRRSRVEIDINGRSVYRQIVDSGKYELRDFPLQIGRNDITIRTFDELGNQNEKQLEYFHNPSLMPKGESEFQFFTGFPYKEISDIEHLDEKRLTNLAYWRYGLSSRLGTSAYMQTVRDNILVGAIGEFALGSNIASIEVAHSRSAIDQLGHAVRLRAYSSNGGFTKKLSFFPSYYTINLDYTSLHFDHSFLEYKQGVRNSLKTSISPSLIWQITSCCQIQATALFINNRNKTDEQALEIRSYIRQKGLQVDLSFEHTFHEIQNHISFFTNITWRPHNTPRNRLQYRYKNATKQHTLSANVWSEKNKYLNYQMNGTYVNPINNSVDGMIRYQKMNRSLSTQWSRDVTMGYANESYTLDYNGPRALISINHTSQKTWDTTTNMRLDSSIAFVGKHWGISQPINNSFAILYPNNEGMNKSTIRFKEGSVLDGFSSAVYPFLGNYQSREIGIETADVPIGLDLGPQQFLLQSRVNSGIAIPVGTAGGIIMASAILQRPNGKPLDLEVGTCTHKDTPELTRRFFTNREGKLYLQGLKSGTYIVELLGDQYAPLTITIPPKAQSPFNIGTITLREKPSEESENE